MRHAVYNVSWACIFLLNVTAVVMSFASPWGARDDFSSSPFLLVSMVFLCTAAVSANIIVTDIAAEYLCILFGVIKLKRRKKTRPALVVGSVRRPVSIGTEPYLVVYCLKSKLASDVKNVLSSLEKSWVNNKSFSNAVYLILSGTHDADLYMEEMNAVRDWNLLRSEDSRVVCKYLRRTRSILYKYGQYLDLIMLLNGHTGNDGVALFKDSLPEGGGCFDAKTDVDEFKGRVEYDRLVILDRDNVLGDDFFAKSDKIFGNSNCEIDIIQPAIVPFDIESREDTIYEAISISSHEMGSNMSESRGEYFPSATFFGKGVIRRTKYNEILMGYNLETFSTEENTRIPR